MTRPRGATFAERTRYAIDNSLAKGVWIVLVWMGIGLGAAVIVIGCLIWALGAGPGDRPVPLIEGIWIALTRSLDPGTFGQDVGPQFRVAGLVITLIGLLAVALLIGLVASAVTQRLDELRQGRSIVLESDHMLILGYSGKLPLVVRELLEANASDRGRALVILTPHDKVELEQLLKREGLRKGARVIVRRGEPSSLRELAQGRPELARSIVILRPDEPDADAEVIKVALAVRKAREGVEQIPIVAELQDPSAARGLRQALPGQIMTVVTGEVVARVAAQASRAAGLGTLYQELLDFDGNEIYRTPVPTQLVGRSFSDALLASDNCCVLGVIDCSGEVLLCPHPGRVLHPDEHLIVIASDDSAIQYKPDASMPSPSVDACEALRLRPASRERVLIIGWNPMGPRIVAELDQHVAPDSHLHLLVDDHVSVDLSTQDWSHLTNQRVSIQRGSIIDRLAIDEAISNGPFDHIMVLCQHDDLTALQADARTLLALLHVRNALGEVAGQPSKCNIVTEVLQNEAVDLAQVAQPDDYIVSQRLVSLLIAQLVEDSGRKPVLYELLDSRGARFIFYPVEDCDLTGSFSFRQVVERFRGMGAIAIGWQARASVEQPGSLRGGIRVNPHKTESIAFVEGDRIIILTHQMAGPESWG